MDSGSFPSAIRYDADPLALVADIVRRELLQSGAIIIRGLPRSADNAELVALSMLLGTPSETSIVPAGEASEVVESGFIHRVESQQTPVLNASGHPVLSLCSGEFECHTDEYFLDVPAALVLLHCVRNDPDGGGLSLVLPCRVLLEFLEDSVKDLLSRRMYPHPTQLVSVLDRESGETRVRYNRYEVEGYYRAAGVPVPSVIQQVFDRVSQVARDRATRVHLSEGDCLVLDNYSVLHGRTAFDGRSPRLLKRVRLRKRFMAFEKKDPAK